VLAERVRQRLPDVPVLLTTGFMDELGQQDSGPYGKNILTKPYRRGELAERVRVMLGNAGPGAGRQSASFRHEG